MPGRLTEELRRITRAQSARRRVAGDNVDDDVTGGPGSQSEGGGDSPGHGRAFGWLGLLLLLTLVVGGWFLVRQLQEDSKLQDCVMSGRKNCAPIDLGR
jgi:hypothetical protein